MGEASEIIRPVIFKLILSNTVENFSQTGSYRRSHDVDHLTKPGIPHWLPVVFLWCQHEVPRVPRNPVCKPPVHLFVQKKETGELQRGEGTCPNSYWELIAEMILNVKQETRPRSSIGRELSGFFFVFFFPGFWDLVLNSIVFLGCILIFWCCSFVEDFGWEHNASCMWRLKPHVL